jgi:regulator of sigma E protease
MGPVMNLVLAFVLTGFVVYQGYEQPIFLDQPVVVGVVTPDSPAAKADIRPRDRVTAVSGRATRTWEEFLLAIGGKANREVKIAIDRGGVTITKSVTPIPEPTQPKFEVGDIGIQPDVHPLLREITAGEPGDKAGLKSGDRILAIDGTRMTFQWQLREQIAKHPDETLRFTVARGDAQLDLDVRIGSRDGGKQNTIGWLGVRPADDMKTVRPENVVAAAQLSWQRNVQFGQEIFRTVWGLLTRETSPKQLMGPVAIAQLSGESASIGWLALFGLMASLSLNLGILNLLPIPVLDGGHIFIMALEGVARRDFSVKAKEKVMLAGFFALVLLMSAVIYNDLTRISWISRLMPWR